MKITHNPFTPTPKKMRRLGNALVGASQGIAVPAVYADQKYIALGVLLAGWIGKLLTEFFTEEEDNKQA